MGREDAHVGAHRPSPALSHIARWTPPIFCSNVSVSICLIDNCFLSTGSFSGLLLVRGSRYRCCCGGANGSARDSRCGGGLRGDWRDGHHGQQGCRMREARHQQHLYSLCQQPPRTPRTQEQSSRAHVPRDLLGVLLSRYRTRGQPNCEVRPCHMDGRSQL